MPTETQTPRLIDANALKEIIEEATFWEEEVCINIEALKKIIDSAPTVETTDDVLKEYESIVKNLRNRTESDYAFTGESQRVYDRGQIDAYEAIIKSLNRK